MTTDRAGRVIWSRDRALRVFIPQRRPGMHHSVPALAHSVFTLLLADSAILREILMCLDTPDRLVRGPSAIQSYRYGFLLASRIVPAHRGCLSVASVAPLVPIKSWQFVDLLIH